MLSVAPSISLSFIVTAVRSFLMLLMLHNLLYRSPSLPPSLSPSLLGMNNAYNWLWRRRKGGGGGEAVEEGEGERGWLLASHFSHPPAGSSDRWTGGCEEGAGEVERESGREPGRGREVEGREG